jgi:preprotein translocase subunit SecY
VVILKNLKNIFSIPELRKKLFFTLGVLIIYRLGTYIPVIGVDVNRLRDFMQQASKLSGLLGYLDVFSGGALAQCTLFALGIMPYITASIMMQVLGFTVPYFEQLLKEGEFGKRLINQYTRYVALGISIVYSSMYAAALESYGLVLEPDWTFRFVFILSLSVGCMAVMWLGEQISLFGIGNGSSMLIFAGIVARFPDYVIKTIHAVQTSRLDAIVGILIWIAFILITACIVFLEKGDRKIPVQYARRVIGQRVYGGQNTYIPFKINSASVMPVIFASSVLNIPLSVAGMLAKKYKFFSMVYEKMSQTGLLFNVLQFILIVFFYFFYTALVFNPTELADNIKKSGGFIPGLRPGRKTAEFFDHILTRLGLVGATYLGLLAVLPNVMAAVVTMPFYLGGTALLIVVGVALDTSSQIESYLIEHNYEGFLSSGRLKPRGAR